MLDPKLNDFAMKVAAKLRYVGIVCVQKRDPTGREGGDQLILRAGDSSDSFRKEFQMNRGDRSHYSPVRSCDFAECCDFSRVRHSHFDHGNVVFRLELQKLERQTEMIEIGRASCRE